ncbi:SulP family inorganic anion transporter [Salinibacterium hongtaonis]|nr:SulP family inorganic anion transporter [Salinibacterium hongtaonis]AWB88171.1 sulfate transporter [Salinibacterium hongtaonis]
MAALFPTLAGYQRSWLGRDLLAGFSAGAVVIPQAMAYATVADLPVQVGLYTCIVPMFVYALLGGSHAMSVSTTSTIATLTATTLVSAGVTSHSDNIPRDLVTLSMLVGVILLIARLLRLGSVVEVISRPTLIGLQAAVGVTVATGQLPKLLGEDTEESGHGFIRSLAAAIEAVPQANLATILLSAGSLAALFLFKRFIPAAPAPLIVAAGGIILVAVGVFSGLGVTVLKPLGQVVPTLTLPTFDHVLQLLPGAFAIAVLAFVETSAVGRSIREPGERPLDSNRELLATAGASLLGGLFQSLPAAGGFSQSAVNKNAGARSQVSAIVTVALALLVGLFLGSLIGLLPQATLASLVFFAMLGLIDVRTLAHLWHVSRRDFWVAMVTLAIGLAFGLLSAVAAGVVFTLLLLLTELSKPRVASSTDSEAQVTITLLEPLYTANVRATEQAILDEVDARPGVRIVILDLEVLQEISIAVLDGFEDLDHELSGRGVELRLRSMPRHVVRVAARTEWYARLARAGRVIP